MRVASLVAIASLVVAGIVARASAAYAQEPIALQRALESALHREGAAQPGGVVRFAFARSDLTVRVGDVQVKPALALGSWAAFKDVGGGQAVAAGDLVLTDPDVAPVMSALQRGGIEPTAVHNHLLNESPHIVYMHIAGRGEPAKLAAAIYNGLSASHTPLGAAPAPAAPSAAGLDTAAIARELRASGKLSGVVYQLSIPRTERITMMGEEIPPSMGVATGINFQPTGGGKAAIAGDFVLRPNEVTPVMRTLRASGIDVTAVHSHMIDEEPRLIFMHFWANADAVTLAKGLRAALDQTASKR